MLNPAANWVCRKPLPQSAPRRNLGPRVQKASSGQAKIATGQAAGARGNACPKAAEGQRVSRSMSQNAKQAAAPILIVPFMWIGDFVRCHSVVKLLRAAAPERPVDIVSSTLCAPLADYMPGIRRAIVADLPRGRLGLSRQRQLAADLRLAGYRQALVMSRKWKAALAPWLAGIPERTGFAGEFRFGLLNDVRYGERDLSRMIDQMGALALPKAAPLPNDWPLPELKVPARDIEAWLASRGL